MAIDVKWATDVTGVVMITFGSRWMGVDLVDVVSQVRELTDEYGQPCTVVCNLNPTLAAPDNLLPTVRNILNGNLPQQVTRVVVVAESPIWRKLFQVAHSLYADHFYFDVVFVRNMIEARAYFNPPAAC